MSVGLYRGGGKAFLEGLQWQVSNFRAVLVDASYVVNRLTHVNLTDVPSSSIIASSEFFTFKTTDGGIAGAGSLRFLTPLNQRTVAGFVLYQDSGFGPVTSRLIYFGDSTIASGLPLLTGTAVITASFPNGIFKL